MIEKLEKILEVTTSYFSGGSASQLKSAPGLGALAPCVSEHSIMKGFFFFILYIRTSWEKKKRNFRNLFLRPNTKILQSRIETSSLSLDML